MMIILSCFILNLKNNSCFLKGTSKNPIFSSLRDPKDCIKQAKMTNKVPPLKGVGGCFFLFVISNEVKQSRGQAINGLLRAIALAMTLAIGF